jgi:thiamine biosynthesis lipoprotein
MKAVLALVAGLGVAVPATAAPGPDAPLASLREWVMGTMAELRVHAAADAPVARAALDRAMAEIRDVDRLMAVQRPDSDVSRANREAAERAVGVDPRVLEVLRTSMEVSRLTDGAFDVTVLPVVLAWGFTGSSPARPAGVVPRPAGYRTLRLDGAAGTVRFSDARTGIDLGGIAKGYALDRARDVLRAAGVRSAWLDLGGEIATIGTPPGGGRWRIAVRHPRRSDAVLGIVEVGEAAVSTSGDAERFVDDAAGRAGHIFDPHTGRPAQGLVTATVVAASATLADALSTAAVVMGDEAFERLARRLDVGAVLGELVPAAEIRVRVTPGLRFEPA